MPKRSMVFSTALAAIFGGFFLIGAKPAQAFTWCPAGPPGPTGTYCQIAMAGPTGCRYGTCDLDHNSVCIVHVGEVWYCNWGY
jgi:hypothetical protein